jgi:SpoVK/Ycf46/Vps4 family AAA+-type ATPase
MKAETTLRLFRAIAQESKADIDILCRKIIAEEKRKGHTKLADQLDSIFRKANPDSSSVPSPALKQVRNLKLDSLPRTNRDNQLLVQSIDRESLRHHMVLPDYVESRFISVEKEYAASKRLAKYGLVPKKKILLYGPPGCGKTLGAERLAHNTGLPLLKVRMDALVSSYLGESASNLRKVFELATAHPCVLLLDECDFIAKSRDKGNDVGEIPRIVNMLLILLDEFEAPGLLVATTNLETSLDSAIFRRFDDSIEVSLPSADDIARLMSMSLSSIRQAKDLSLSSYSKKMEGASAAVVVKVAQAAAKNAILMGRDVVANMDIEKSISELISQHSH